MAKVLVQSIQDYSYAQLATTDGRAFIIDEPEDLGGDGLGPDPYELMLWALGACTAITLQMYARRKGIPLFEIAVEVEHEKVHAEDCLDCVEEHEGTVEVIRRRITVQGDGITEEQRESLLRIAQRCPVHRTLTSAPEIIDSLDAV